LNLSDMRFPRHLEADYSPDIIRRVLMDRTVKLWAGSDLDVPLIALTNPLKKSLQAAMDNGHVRYGFEGVKDKLNGEKAGIANIRERSGVPHGERISRLILFSNDGAERFCRHVEQLLRSHGPRLLGCFLDTDSSILGRLITGEDRQIKLVMAEHKDAVSEILRAMLDELLDGVRGNVGTVSPSAQRIKAP
jgi:hypothetical protein